LRRPLVLAGVLLLAGCGDDAAVSGGGGDRPQLVVSAAAALEPPLSACAEDFEDATLTLRFGGADALAAEIRGEEPVDVLATGSKPARALAQAGKLSQPVVFAKRQAATYAAGVVRRSERPDAAEAFVDDLLAGGCHDALVAAGFDEPR